MQQGSQIKLLFIDSKRGIHGWTDYKLRGCFEGLDPFFKSSQPILPLLNSSEKCLDLNSASLKLAVWDKRASISTKIALCASSYCRTSSF